MIDLPTFVALILTGFAMGLGDATAKHLFHEHVVKREERLSGKG